MSEQPDPTGPDAGQTEVPPHTGIEDAAAAKPPFYVPANDDRLLGDVLLEFANRFNWGTRVFFRWVLVIIGIGTGLYVWVTVRRDASTAFDVITQHLSPMGSNLGVAGVLLGIYGYFLAPAMVGAVVGGVYTTSAAMSGKRVRRTAAEIAEKAQHGPGKIHKALNKVKLGQRRP
ncbi:Uncharacterised protein [Mycobacteroides abscessus subsp. abscessus]|uniref:hypothetical protein n=1 Tax=Mycobacteroides abscessus TaxID=36809 RepID=UPI0009A72AB8|nr:hypothetical protein [Mycobacteroides abscessus]SLI00837.1 Uncharacterised protein [Mycobacteroides abscessus subsp. abscessus]